MVECNLSTAYGNKAKVALFLGGGSEGHPANLQHWLSQLRNSRALDQFSDMATKAHLQNVLHLQSVYCYNAFVLAELNLKRFMHCILKGRLLVA